jgi:Beta-galactosidase
VVGGGWRSIRRGVGLLAGLVAMLVPVGGAGAAVPDGFFGVVPQGVLSNADAARMQGTVGTVRLAFDWGQVEPRRGEWDFAGLDGQISAVTRRGIRVMPVLYGTPSWLNDDPARPPTGAAQRAGWARFVRRAVGRYGPAGSFWKERSRPLPIHRWQVWNEPNFLLFWRPRPEPRRYAELLGDTARAIRRLDPHVTIVAAGVAPVEGGMPPARFLQELYAVRGAKRSFDVVALHPYSTSVGGIAFQVQQLRGVMAAAGDGAKPLQVTEIGVASAAAEPTPFDKGPRGQARFLRRALGLLLAERRGWRIAGADWFSLEDGAAVDPHCAFCEHAGLLHRNGTPKPAWWAFRRLAAERNSSAAAGFDRPR